MIFSRNQHFGKGKSLCCVKLARKLQVLMIHLRDCHIGSRAKVVEFRDTQINYTKMKSNVIFPFKSYPD